MSMTRSQRIKYSVPHRSRTHTCPECDDQVFRVPRRLIDRLINLFTPVQRYKCMSPHCNWEGNLASLPEPRAQSTARKEAGPHQA